MKNPNGYGSVIKLGGKRRKPFAARVTAGWELNEKTGKEKQKYDYIGYYESRPQAMIALADYNKDPYDIDAKKITYAEIYLKWSKERYKIGQGDEASYSVISSYSTAYNQTKELHDMAFVEIRAHHMQGIIDDNGLKHSSNIRIKTLFSQLFAYARKNDITEKDYAEFIVVPQDKNKDDKTPFTNKEIKKLWNHKGKFEVVDAALIMIYTGLRISELLMIKKTDINLEERFLTGGLKTDAGKNRVVPLNEKIIPILKRRIESKGDSLFINSQGDPLLYQTFRREWIKITKHLNLDHTIHECRHTFGTLMDNAGANKVSIKKIMGHAISDITDGVYTHKDLEQLLIAVDLI
jgi:integrase